MPVCLAADVSHMREVSLRVMDMKRKCNERSSEEDREQSPVFLRMDDWGLRAGWGAVACPLDRLAPSRAGVCSPRIGVAIREADTAPALAHRPAVCSCAGSS
eukprot:GHVU01161635.1.p2 GENE.GHVU01161635.1~~GHVU01161635.1.p2  ORF type:complete len:102 (-),score=6.31 GHVU01161635.1:445-750(-)